LVAIAAHAIQCRPTPTPRIVVRSDGRAELPDTRLMELTIGPGSRYTSWWVRLELHGEAVRAVEVVLLVDQVDRRTWRALQAELRRARPPPVLDASSAGGDGDTPRDLR
jgi:predicted nucleic acid-binding protein